MVAGCLMHGRMHSLLQVSREFLVPFSHTKAVGFFYNCIGFFFLNFKAQYSEYLYFKVLSVVIGFYNVVTNLDRYEGVMCICKTSPTSDVDSLFWNAA